MYYIPYEIERRDLVWPRGASGNFILSQLHIDTNITYHVNEKNEYFFEHCKAYTDVDYSTSDSTYVYLKDNMDIIYQLAHDIKQLKNIIWEDRWFLSLLVSLLNDIKSMDYSFCKHIIDGLDKPLLARICIPKVKNSVLISTGYHNKILAKFKQENIIICGRHVPDINNYLNVDPLNKDFKNYLNNDINYNFGYIGFDENSKSHEYVTKLRSLKHNDNTLFAMKNSLYQKEVIRIKKLHPEHENFDWGLLFFEKAEDEWERLFCYYEKKQQWDTYKTQIIENVNLYMENNDRVLDIE